MEGVYLTGNTFISIKWDDLVEKMGRIGEKWDDFTGGLLPTMWVSELRAFLFPSVHSFLYHDTATSDQAKWAKNNIRKISCILHLLNGEQNSEDIKVSFRNLQNLDVYLSTVVAYRSNLFKIHYAPKTASFSIS